MGWRSLATKVLAVFGAVLVSLPILATLLTGVEGSVAAGALRIDWLMPGELGVFALVGAAMLLTASLLSRRRRTLVVVGILVMVGAAIAGAVFAQLSGLATGATEPVGWPVVALIGLVAVYTAGIVELAVSGVLLSMDLLRHHAPPAGTATPTV